MKLAKSLKVLRVDPQGSDAVLLSFTPDAAQQADFHVGPPITVKYWPGLKLAV